MMPLHTLKHIRQALAAGEVSVEDLVRSVWRRVAQAGIGPDGDPAWLYCASADQIEQQLARLRRLSPEDAPLYGVPFAVKDNIDVEGWPTTAACPAFTHVAARSATVVERLQQAGAVLIGKTNLDQFATGLVGTRSPYGAVPNTFSSAHVCGGSSSGSASVVARGLVCFALGTDTAGSGRVPAGFNNLVGLKPTPGCVSISGVVPAVRSVDCVSVFALSAADAQAVLHVISGPDAGEPRFHPEPMPRFAFGEPLRLGIPQAPFFVSDDYRRQFDEAIGFAGSLGAGIGRFDMRPLTEVARQLYEGPWVAERLEAAGPYLEGESSALDPVVARVVSAGRAYSALDAFRALYRVRELGRGLETLWERFDALLVPTAPNLPSLADVAASPVVRNSELGTYTNFVNLLGWAAVAVPFGFGEAGLPFGVTLIGPGGSDEALLRLADQWQRVRELPLGRRLESWTAPDALLAPPAAQSIAVAVVGAHLRGMPLHRQVVEAGAALRLATTTASHYRLFALAGTVPPKPGLVRTEQGGAAIEVEVYDFPRAALGDFVAGIPPPLGIGSLELRDGQWVKGFICEPAGLEEAVDITAFGGWRAYMADRAARD